MSSEVWLGSSKDMGNCICNCGSLVWLPVKVKVCEGKMLWPLVQGSVDGLHGIIGGGGSSSRSCGSSRRSMVIW